MKQNNTIKSFQKNFNNIHQKNLFCPLFILTWLVIINISNIEAAKRRLCGKRLTSELWRVCTKQGTKGPCIHGVKKRIISNQKNFFLKEKKSLWKNYFNLWNLHYKIIKKGLSNTLFINNDYLHKKQHNDNSILDRNKRKGIVDQCCKGEGCDEEFLDSFCCNEDEEKKFEEIN